VQKELKALVTLARCTKWGSYNEFDEYLSGIKGHFLSKDGACRPNKGNSSALTWMTARARDSLYARVVTSDLHGHYKEIGIVIRFKPAGVSSICKHCCPGTVGISEWNWHCTILK